MLDVQAGSRIFDSDQGHCQIAWRSIYVCNTIAEATPANISSLVKNFDAFATRRHDYPIAFLLLTQAGTSPPSAVDRKRVIDTLAKHAEKIGGVGICLAVEGFAGAILRSVASAVFLLPRTRYEMQFFSNQSDAAAWAATIAGCSATQALELIELAEEGVMSRE